MTVTTHQVQLVVVLLALALVVALLARRLRLPYTLLLVLAGLLLGFVRILPGLRLEPESVLLIFLPALLFEGAWSVEVRRLRRDWIPVFLLAVPGLVLSLAVVALVLHFGLGLDWLTALLVGTVVSPTDPVAVLALLRQMGMPPRLRTIIESESLFNDGVGAAAYVIILGLLVSSETHVVAPSLGTISRETVWLLIGGPLIGTLVGWLAAQLLRTFDDHLIEITLTFSIAYGVYLIGTGLQTSGLLAVVVAGLIMGSYGRRVAMSDITRGAADEIWEFTGFVANSLLFLLLGVQIGATNFAQSIPGIIWAVVGVVAGRALMILVFLPAYNAIARWWGQRHAGAFDEILPIPRIWRPLILLSGLRGALSLALVLSLPPTIPHQDQLRGIVYGVVLVTLVGQGLGLRVLLPRWPQAPAEDEMKPNIQVPSPSTDYLSG